MVKVEGEGRRVNENGKRKGKKAKAEGRWQGKTQGKGQMRMAPMKVGEKGEGDEGEWHKVKGRRGRVEELEGKKRERQGCKVKGGGKREW